MGPFIAVATEFLLASLIFLAFFISSMCSINESIKERKKLEYEKSTLNDLFSELGSLKYSSQTHFAEKDDGTRITKEEVVEYVRGIENDSRAAVYNAYISDDYYHSMKKLDTDFSRIISDSNYHSEMTCGERQLLGNKLESIKELKDGAALEDKASKLLMGFIEISARRYIVKQVLERYGEAIPKDLVSQWVCEALGHMFDSSKFSIKKCTMVYCFS